MEAHLPSVPDGHHDQIVFRKVARNRKRTSVPFYKVGAEIEHPDVHMLVQMGVAVPADDACAEACGMDEAQMAAAQKAYQRVVLGIHPEDYELFDAGVILGYEPDGEFKPGPNFHLLEQATADEDEDEGEEPVKPADKGAAPSKDSGTATPVAPAAKSGANAA